MLLQDDDIYVDIYFEYKEDVISSFKELQDAIETNTEYLNDGEAWVKLQYIATELDNLKGVI